MKSQLCEAKPERRQTIDSNFLKKLEERIQARMSQKLEDSKIAEDADMAPEPDAGEK